MQPIIHSIHLEPKPFLLLTHSKKPQSTVSKALILYVDDIVVTGNNTWEVKSLKKYLGKKLEIKDLGQLRHLGLRWFIPRKVFSRLQGYMFKISYKRLNDRVQAMCYSN